MHLEDGQSGHSYCYRFDEHFSVLQVLKFATFVIMDLYCGWIAEDARMSFMTLAYE